MESQFWNQAMSTDSPATNCSSAFVSLGDLYSSRVSSRKVVCLKVRKSWLNSGPMSRFSGLPPGTTVPDLVSVDVGSHVQGLLLHWMRPSSRNRHATLIGLPPTLRLDPSRRRHAQEVIDQVTQFQDSEL